MESINWPGYAALAISGVLVPLAVELLKRYWRKAPAILKRAASLFAGAALALVAGQLSELLGAPVDLSLIEQVLTGGSAGAAATMGFWQGKRS